MSWVDITIHNTDEQYDIRILIVPTYDIENKEIKRKSRHIFTWFNKVFMSTDYSTNH